MSSTAASRPASGEVQTNVEAWLAAAPDDTSGFDADSRRYSAFWTHADALLDLLPAKPRRSAPEQATADTIMEAARTARLRFLAVHVETLYDTLTQGRSRFIRLQDLVLYAADKLPGLVPSRARLAFERDMKLSDKDGAEIDQGLFLAAVLASERAGTHLCHAMLLPRAEAVELLPKLARDGAVDLGPAAVTRKGRAAHLTLRNPRFLNAEDETTLDAAEIATDLAILDPDTQVAVLRGGPVEHPRYKDRHILGAGINLTHLYRGRIPYVWFLQRDLGYLHKIFRGVAKPEVLPDDVHGVATEKPWICAVDTFAIGGHCQLLLVMDYVIAADDAYLTLPARKEGIIPGFANLRLPRFVGDRMTRQLIQYGRRLECDSAEGRLICDEIAPAAEMDGAISRAVERLTDSGAVSSAGNRRAIRVAQEPLDLFRRYAATYAREQAFCHYSSALIANLERHWNAQQRKV